MEEEFFSTIKLITGEEIVSKVCYFTDEDSLFLDHPMKVESVKQRKSGNTVEGFVLTEWIHATYDNSFILPMKHVVTMTELDKRIERYYLSYIETNSDDENSTNRVPTKQMKGRMGYLGSIKETKKLLEEIYKRS